MMDDLIKRLEALDGPCRECDALIGIAARQETEHDWFWRNYDAWSANERGLIKAGCDGPVLTANNYTSSIDAAITLVPDGWEWNDGHVTRAGGDYQGQTHVVRDIYKGEICSGFHKSAPIAICIAALKARASQ